MFTFTCLPVVLPRTWRSSSTFAPPLPMTTPGFAVLIVTVTWFVERSMSMREIAASRRRARMALRMPRSSFSRVG
jgi:hypothetical protein